MTTTNRSCIIYIIETVTIADLVADGWDRDDAWEALGRQTSGVVVSNAGYTVSQTLYHLCQTHRRSDRILAGAAGIYNTVELARQYIADEAARIAAEQSASA